MVNISREITAEVGGTIGGFTINETDLTATNFVSDTSAKKIDNRNWQCQICSRRRWKVFS